MFEEIKERVFSLDEPIAQNTFGIEACSVGTYVHSKFVYYETTKPIVITSGLFYKELSTKGTHEFKDFLNPNFQFWDCLILSTLYFQQRPSIIEIVLNDKVMSLNSVVNELLKVTHGFIVFSYQFEQIAQLILGISNDDAIALRKLFNKLPHQINHMIFDSDKLEEFKRILTRHLITDAVHQPNYIGAANLMSLYEKRAN
jgi:hypothetical protein